VAYYFIDGKTLRTRVRGTIDNSQIKTVHFSNPQGMISEESIEIISNLNSGYPDIPAIMFVKGEEDLLVLPLIIYLPENVLIFYGQPPITDSEPPVPAGLGLLRITTKLKLSIQSLMERFERV
jgi:uncharacterized protein (UPF0218 family)